MNVIRRHLELSKLFGEHANNPPDALADIVDVHPRFVPGDGVFNPKLILVGEAPGAKEVVEGSPFVGPSGDYLNSLLLAEGFYRDQVWVTNVVKFRPPRNRTPEPEEVEASLPLLRREVRLVAGERRIPLVGLGGTACRALTGQPISVTRRHGEWYNLKAGWKLYVSYHPAAGLRNSKIQVAMGEDFRRLGMELREEEVS